MRRVRPLLVVHQQIEAINVPDKPPELPRSRYLKGRMNQMRSSLGMTESEIDSLVSHSAGVREAGIPPKDPAHEDAPVTWASIVDQREREGKLYSPRTIMEAFPYTGGMPHGVKEFKDEHREEQLLAHMKAKTNHPMSVMQEINLERVHFIFGSLFCFFIGFYASRNYMKQLEYDNEPGMGYTEFYLSKDEAEMRVKAGDEELVPILQWTNSGAVMLWVPTSRAAHMMWYKRDGAKGKNNRFLNPAYEREGLCHPMVAYTYPANLGPLVDTPEAQQSYQELL
eukprot:gene19514-30072_t